MSALSIKSKTLSLRPRRNRDDEFLRRAYESSRDEEFKDVLWPTPEAREVFFTQQFNAQSEHFQNMYELLDYDIIEYNGKAIGRLLLSWEEHHLHCVDIILLPKLRKQQLGTTIMNAIIREVDKRGITASLMFEKWKPYLEAFYNKYGFVTTKEYQAHKYMERPAKTQANGPD